MSQNDCEKAQICNSDRQNLFDRCFGGSRKIALKTRSAVALNHSLQKSFFPAVKLFHVTHKKVFLHFCKKKSLVFPTAVVPGHFHIQAGIRGLATPLSGLFSPLFAPLTLAYHSHRIKEIQFTGSQKCSEKDERNTVYRI